MAVSLRKGQKLSLRKNNLKRVKLELGWKEAAESVRISGIEYDLDASVFMTDQRNICKKDEDMIFYGNLNSICGSVKHGGDELSGSADGGECENIMIDLDKIPQTIQSIVAVVTIYDEKGLGLHFGQIESSYIRVLNADTNEVLGVYNLNVEGTGSNAIIFGSLLRNGSSWEFEATGEEFNSGLEGLCRKYAIDVR